MDYLADMQDTAVALLGARPEDVLTMTPGEYFVAVNSAQAKHDRERFFFANMTDVLVMAFTGKSIGADRLVGKDVLLRQQAREAEWAERERRALILAKERAAVR